MTLALFFIIYLMFFLGLRLLNPLLHQLRFALGNPTEVESLRQSVLLLRSLQDGLETGLIPDKQDWARVRKIPAPWGELFFNTLMESRDRGSPVIPSLGRMQRLLEEQATFITKARTQLAPAMGQAMLSLILVPMFSTALWFLLPGLSASRFVFATAVFVAMILSIVSFFWMTEMGESARFGCLPASKRPWMGHSVVALERLNALVSMGNPPDLAWNLAMEELHRHSPDLAIRWGSVVWIDPVTTLSTSATETLLVQLGTEVRRVIQTSVIEGQAALERVDALSRSFQSDLRGRVEQELATLGNRCLKPLFVLVLPAVMLVMGAGLMISLKGMLKGMN